MGASQALVYVRATMTADDARCRVLQLRQLGYLTITSYHLIHAVKQRMYTAPGWAVLQELCCNAFACTACAAVQVRLEWQQCVGWCAAPCLLHVDDALCDAVIHL